MSQRLVGGQFLSQLQKNRPVERVELEQIGPALEGGLQWRTRRLEAVELKIDHRQVELHLWRLRQRDADEARIQSECVQKLDQGLREQAHAVCNQLYDDNDAERLTELGTLYGQHGD